MLMTAPRSRPVPKKAMGANLVIFFAFALAALLMLTRTVLSAVQIDANVDHAIKPVISSVQANTSLLPVLQKTADFTAQIRASSATIGATVSGVAQSTAHINSTLAAVYQHVLSIEHSVDGITTSVTGIRETITQLGPTVRAIGNQSGDIDAEYGAVATRVSGLPRDITSTAHSLKQIQALIDPIDSAASGIRTVLKSIDGHVIAIADNPLIQLSNLLQLLNLLGA